VVDTENKLDRGKARREVATAERVEGEE